MLIAKIGHIRSPMFRRRLGFSTIGSIRSRAACVRASRDWIEALVHSELDTALQRPRYGRSTGGETEPAVAPVRGYRNGSRTRTLTGTFGKTDITVPRARLRGADGAIGTLGTHDH